MATYAELLSAKDNQTLKDKIRVAIVIAAEVVRTESAGTTNHTARLVWAKDAYSNPEAKMDSMMWAVLAQNQAVAIGTILAASDATVQTAVNAAVDVFA